MATAATSNRAYLWFLEFIKLIEVGNYLRVKDTKIGKNVNYYILGYSDIIIENENNVMW
ncbi:MAG: hypothetical protein AABX06_00075 [Thermoproteota archaeon]|jgi:hypothetical protein